MDKKSSDDGLPQPSIHSLHCELDPIQGGATSWMMDTGLLRNHKPMQELHQTLNASTQLHFHVEIKPPSALDIEIEVNHERTNNILGIYQTGLH